MVVFHVYIEVAMREIWFTSAWFVCLCSTGDLKTLSLWVQDFVKLEINYPFSSFFPFSLPPISCIDRVSVVYVTRDISNIIQECLVNTLSFICVSDSFVLALCHRHKSMTYMPSVKLWGNTSVFGM